MPMCLSHYCRPHAARSQIVKVLAESARRWAAETGRVVGSARGVMKSPCGKGHKDSVAVGNGRGRLIPRHIERLEMQELIPMNLLSRGWRMR